MSPADPRPFPWDEALALGLGRLGWRPRDFWSASPRELAAALGRRGGPGSLSRSDFLRLLDAHPDPAGPPREE